ncbi:MAG: ImmA/IrrE family metallo-endopeptidase [Planctomycetes bacterium]|nr:ImmA/IrrE family metallo-endopeptidase [Planctomycetota bacterium]
MTTEIPYVSDEELSTRAERFLHEHNPAATVPVPIEEIVEFRLGLDIVPVPGLRGVRGIDGYLSSDRSSILVDDAMFRSFQNRYRFTLAHEVGHLVLHGDLYRGFRSEAEWIEFHRDLASHVLHRAEYQANYFAGCVLVPGRSLPGVAQDAVRNLSRPVQARDPDFDLSSEAFWTYVAEEVARKFFVSTETARIELQRNGLWRRAP